MGKWKAMKATDKVTGQENYWVEKTDERYGYPAVLVAGGHAPFLSLRDAEDFAKRLNGENEQLKLF